MTLTDGRPSPARIAIISDIHGNSHALEAVLAEIDRRELTDVVCLGDVVGYGAMPNECIRILRERGIPTLAGNHDHAAVGIVDITFFNDIAKRAVYWTREVLTDEHVKWLKDLPYVSQYPPEFYFVHASPCDPPAWNYVLTFGEARGCFNAIDHRFCFIGHSHQPTVVEKSGQDLTCPEGYTVPIRNDCRYLINVGSVGQPRDRNPAACFVHLDMDEGLIHFVRTPYDIEGAQKAILEQKLPEELAERLAYGW
jgi:diadenosine tetraphosphatase ApaH/serine/threonine PP2A family protein phosphatase